MRHHRIALIPGDGIGHDVIAEGSPPCASSPSCAATSGSTRTSSTGAARAICNTAG